MILQLRSCILVPQISQSKPSLRLASMGGTGFVVGARESAILLYLLALSGRHRRPLNDQSRQELLARRGRWAVPLVGHERNLLIMEN